jgi:hypothetical protein
MEESRRASCVDSWYFSPKADSDDKTGSVKDLLQTSAGGVSTRTEKFTGLS